MIQDWDYLGAILLIKPTYVGTHLTSLTGFSPHSHKDVSQLEAIWEFLHKDEKNQKNIDTPVVPRYTYLIDQTLDQN